MNPFASQITSFWEAADTFREAYRAILRHDGGQILTCRCGDCIRLQTLRTSVPGLGYCDNHPPYQMQTQTPPHVAELRRLNALIFPLRSKST